MRVSSCVDGAEKKEKMNVCVGFVCGAEKRSALMCGVFVHRARNVGSFQREINSWNRSIDVWVRVFV